jgi:hypothetical protein
MELNGDVFSESDMSGRTLTEADLDALADKVVEKMKKSFYNDIGKGVVGWAFGLIGGALLAFAGWKLGKGS